MGVHKIDRLTRVKVDCEVLHGKQTRCVLALPANLQLVQDLERHLFSRLVADKEQRSEKPEVLTLSVDGFALPGAERIQDVLRDGDLITARSSAVSSTESNNKKQAHSLKLADALSTPPAKARSRSQRRLRCHQTEGVMKTPPSSAALPSSPLPAPPVVAAISKPPCIAEVEAKNNNDEEKKATRFHMKVPGIGSCRKPELSSQPTWTQRGGKDGQPVVLQHPQLGELEVPEGMDAKTFVSKKLKTLQKAVRRQVEHYFSDANWARDEHLQSQADSDGHVNFDAIMDFERLRTLTSCSVFVKECMEGSNLVEISSCGKKLRRRVS